MTMLFGWASHKEKFPLSVVGEAFIEGASILDVTNHRGIIQGKGGTVFGLSFALPSEQVEANFSVKHRNKKLLEKEVGHAIKLDKISYVNNLTWFSLRARLNSPESIPAALATLNLLDLEVNGTLGIITCRGNTVNRQYLDRTAPLEILPQFVGGTVGHITAMVSELAELNINPGSMDGRKVLQKVNEGKNHSTANSYHAAAMAERIFLLRNYAKLPYSLHWILLDPLLDFVHALHSEEKGGGHRLNPYLSIGKNMDTGTVAFASEANMVEHRFGTMDIESPSEGQVRTRFTQVGM